MPEPKRQGPLAVPAHAQQALLVLDEHPVNLTHLEKPLFPDGIHKRDLLLQP